MSHNLRLPVIAVLLALLGSAGVVLWPADDGRETESAAAFGSVLGTTVGRRLDRPAVTHPQPHGNDPFAPRTWQGEVVDLDGVPLEGVPVGFPTTPFDERARTGPDGRFSFVAGPSNVPLHCGAPWATVRAARLDPERPDESGRPTLLVACTAVGIAGRLVDADGTPVADAWVTPSPVPEDLIAVDPADSLQVSAPPVRTDAAGRFVVPCLPAGAVELQVSAPDHRLRRFPAPAIDTTDLRIVLASDPRTDRACFVGRVLHANGCPAAEARVQLGDALEARSDSFGSFVLEVPLRDVPLRSKPWLATLPGFLPATAERNDAAPTLRLPARARRIAGRVRDADGTPRAGLLVFPWHTRVLHPRIEARVEDLAAQRGEPIELAGIPHRAIDRSDAEGRFTVTGLRSGVDYRLRVFDPTTGFAWTSNPRRAGDTTADLVLPESTHLARFAGHLRTRTGRPVAGARIELITPIGPPEAGLTDSVRALGRTGRDGSFALDDLPAVDARLRFSGPMIDDLEVTLDVDGFAADGAGRDLHADRMCRFELDRGGRGSGRIAAVRLLDRDGAALAMRVTLPDGIARVTTLEASRHGTTFLGSERAATAVLVTLDGAEHRVPLHPRPGTIVTLGR